MPAVKISGLPLYAEDEYMPQKDLRTYRRRETTRESGYHTCEATTGGECVLVRADRYQCAHSREKFMFTRDRIELVELFEKGIFLVAFGGCIFSKQKATVSLELGFTYEGVDYAFSGGDVVIEENCWSPIGIHGEKPIRDDLHASNVYAKMWIQSKKSGNKLDFISFDLDAVSKPEFQDTSCAESFYQKTKMHVPWLYYLRTDLPFDQYLIDEPGLGKQDLTAGRRIVMKSCNRCGRYLPINVNDELKTLGYSLHCKKRAPCVHSTFRAYTLQNWDELGPSDLEGLSLERKKVVSYYGHQLECKACKKFFVNAPLNPQRNPQQFKEDGLRRRAIEVLVNQLLDRNLVHFEFEMRTKREFSGHIWKKFGKRCFKCGPDSNPLNLKDLALDHTMPLSYLYRLDESATCLCSSHNSQKSDHFPVDFYSEAELVRLSEITGLSLQQLHSREVNQQVLDLLIKNVIWFYDDFLMNKDYQKVRDGIKTADKINDSLKRVIAGKVDLAEEYRAKTGHYPTSVTIK